MPKLSNERKICSFTQPEKRLQLVEIKELTANKYFLEATKKGMKVSDDYYTTKYQVRLNRKVIDTSISEYNMRKLFAMYVQNIVLQLKIY